MTGPGAPRIRVMLVDDAVVVRRVLKEVLDGDPELEVVAIAQNGRVALEKLEAAQPDVLVLDIEMPEMDGLATLTEVRKRDRRLPVIMFSTLTERGGAMTLEALSRGASDYVTKPTNSANIQHSMEKLREELVPRIKHLAARGRTRGLAALAPARPRSGAPTSSPGDADRGAPGATRRERSTAPAQAPAPVVALRPASGPAAVPDVVAIGVSTGGPNALAEVITALPGDFPVPIVVVQHMPPVFTRLLAERLDRTAALTVREGEAGMPVRPGEVVLAPGGSHMVVTRKGPQVVVGINEDPPENSCRPAVDVLFRSVVDVYGPRVLAAVLTGMGQDGLKGSQEVVAAGGRVLAQDEATSVVWGMPGFVARAGLASALLPLGQVASELIRSVARSRPAAAAGGAR